MDPQPHTDIATPIWIEHLPPRLRPFLYLARIDRPIGIWLLLLPGLWSITLASGGWRGTDLDMAWLFGLFALGAVVMRAAGCVVNDLWDRKLDRMVARTRTRPLASGTIGVTGALLFLASLLILGLLILLQTSPVTILLGILSLPMIAAYPAMKRITWWPQLFLGLTFNFGALMGWSAVTGIIEPPALLLYSAGIFWTLAYDTAYAHQDIEDDALAGIKSTARLFSDHGKPWVTGFYAAATILLCMAGYAAGAGGAYFATIAAACALALWLCARWDPKDPVSCLKFFKASRNFGLLILVAMFVS